MDWITTAIMSLDPSIRSAVITAGATCVAALVGFTAVFFQIGRQSRNAIEQNRKNEALKLKVQIYDETLETSHKAQDAISDLAGYLRGFSTALFFSDELRKANQSHRPPQTRFPEYQRLYREATYAAIGVTTMIEGWHIVEPKLEIFKRAIAMGHDRLMKVSYRSPNVFIVGMPVEGFETKWQIPTEPLADAIKQRIEAEFTTSNCSQRGSVTSRSRCRCCCWANSSRSRWRDVTRRTQINSASDSTDTRNSRVVLMRATGDRRP
jgi:hypothetical protein